MQVEYKKDIRRNYMVISDIENSENEQYSMKLLQNQAIEGVLAMEVRRMDNKLLLYYDITSKQPMHIIFEKAVLNYDKVKILMEKIINIVEIAYEYLLPEDDFILSPEFIYVEVTAVKPALCFLPGYHTCIKEQMSRLIEYLMNKIDYNDREAVLLVYQLYAISREEGYTLEHLSDALRSNQKKDIDERKHPLEEDSEIAQNIDGNSDNLKVTEKNVIEKSVIEKNVCKKEIDAKNTVSKIPVMVEKLEGEKEVLCYALSTYLYTLACIILGILAIFLCFKNKIIYNSFGSRIDYTKLSAMLFILLGTEGYIMQKIWNKKNRITKMKQHNEYIDPRQEVFIKDSNVGVKETGDINFYKERLDKPDHEKISNRYKEMSSNINIEKQLDLQGKKALSNYIKDICESSISRKVLTKEEEEDNPTCLLTEAYVAADDRDIILEQNSLVLKPLDEDQYQSIPITNFPFLIGKLKNNVDYCLDKEVISRYHAKIMKEESVYYITDLNSTNGTFVNGEAVKAYEKREINIKDEISIADIKYQFLNSNT